MIEEISLETLKEELNKVTHDVSVLASVVADIGGLCLQGNTETMLEAAMRCRKGRTHDRTAV